MKKYVVLVSVVMWCLACGGSNESSSANSWKTVYRAFEDASAPDLEKAVFTKNVEVFRWVADGTSADAANQYAEGLTRVGESGTHFRTMTTDPKILWDVDLDATDIDGFEVTFSSAPGSGAVEFFWASEKARFKDGRRLESFGVTNPEDGSVTYAFNLEGHPRWKGDIARLRVDPTDGPGRDIELLSLIGFQKEADLARIRDLSLSEFLIDLCGDVRYGRILPPQMPMSLSVDLPEDARLRFSVGFRAEAETPVTLRVIAEKEGVEETVFEEIVDTLDTGGCGWQDHLIDLSSLGRGYVQLVFHADQRFDSDEVRDIPVIGQIEVAAPSVEPPPPNIVLIVIDTLRADRMSLYGYKRETTPGFTDWAGREGVVFENTITAAPWTLPSHVSLFTGLDSVSHGLTTADTIPLGMEMLAERLQKNGYRTAAFSGGGYLGTKYRLMQGFDTLSYWFRARQKAIEVGNDLQNGIDNTLVWLDKTRSKAPNHPFFLFLHTYEVHTPYRAREPFFGRFHDAVEGEPLPPVKTTRLTSVAADGFRLDKVFSALPPGGEPKYEILPTEYIELAGDLYDSGVAFADQQISKLLADLEKSGLGENTVVVLTSDHGESLGEKGLAGHSSLEEWEIKIPLVIAGPGLEKNRGSRVETQVRLIDIMPTVLELAGIEVPGGIDGVSLLPVVKGDRTAAPGDAVSYAASSNFGLSLTRDNTVKYEFNNSPWAPIFGEERFYSLPDDPLCANDLVKTSAEVDSFREILTERFAAKKAGLRMELSNPSATALKVSLLGDPAKPLTVKSMDTDGGPFDWVNGRVSLVVPAGTLRTIYFEGNPFAELSVRCEAEDRPGFESTIGMEFADDSWRAVLVNGEWNEDTEKTLDGLTGIRVWVHGWTSASESPVEIDAETMEILRGLGYIE